MTRYRKLIIYSNNKLKRRFYYTVAFILISYGGFAQTGSHINVDLGLTQNHQGFFKLFDGIVDVGASYNHELFKNFYGGFAFHMSFLNRKNTSARTTIFKPGIQLNYIIHLSENIAVIPQGNLGYAILNISNKEYSYKEIQSGWNPGGELRVLWKRDHLLDFYIFGRFDYIYLDEDQSFTMLEYYRNVYLTSFGIGMRIKSGYNEK